MWVENWGICRGEKKKKKLKMGRNRLTAYAIFFFSLLNKKELEAVKVLGAWGWSTGTAEEADPEDHI